MCGTEGHEFVLACVDILLKCSLCDCASQSGSTLYVFCPCAICGSSFDYNPAEHTVHTLHCHLCSGRCEGRTEDAISLQKSAVAIKIRVCGEASVQAALSYNELGGFYLQTHNLDAAEQALKKALRVRDDAEFGGMGQGPR